MKIINYLNESEQKVIKINSYKKESYLFHENEECNEIGIVLEGSVEISTTLINGQEVIFRKLNKDDIFGMNLVFSLNNRYKGNIVAKTDCKVGFIKRLDLLKLLQKNDSLLLEYLKEQSNIGLESSEKIKLLSFSNAEDRLIYYLTINNNVVEYQTITLLAKELGIQRETLSRLITKLINKKVIKKTATKIILNSSK